MTDMTYTRLGTSGLIVSRMCFGTMTFNHGSEWIPGVAKVGQDAANDMVHAALDAGVNFFDTADGYSNGESEDILGKALGKRRNEAVICTKLGFRQTDQIGDAGLNRTHVLKQIDGSLDRMGIDHIDLLVLHIWSGFRHPFVESSSFYPKSKSVFNLSFDLVCIHITYDHQIGITWVKLLRVIGFYIL